MRHLFIKQKIYHQENKREHGEEANRSICGTSQKIMVSHDFWKGNE